jgi:hypothetical protein
MTQPAPSFPSGTARCTQLARIPSPFYLPTACGRTWSDAQCLPPGTGTPDPQVSRTSRLEPESLVGPHASAWTRPHVSRTVSPQDLPATLRPVPYVAAPYFLSNLGLQDPQRYFFQSLLAQPVSSDTLSTAVLSVTVSLKSCFTSSIAYKTPCILRPLIGKTLRSALH